MFSFFGVPVDAAYHLVSGLTGIFTPVLGALAAVAVIVVFTMAIRLLLMPLSLRALRGQAVQARLAPQLQALRQRYAKQPERLQRELAALYKREGTSMFAGFAPLLLQWPFLSVMYLLFRSPQVGGTANTLLSRDLLGVPLGMHWLSGAGAASAQGGVFLGVFVPDRRHRGLRSAGGGNLPAHVAGLVAGRARVLLAASRTGERLDRSQHRPRCSTAGGSLRSGPASSVSRPAPSRRVGEITDLHT
jgi:YidC/Oxa1 family membrane protein insertase